ncbi:endospore germination permease [Alkalihalobacillus sp. TS-13]|uniref:GerAB/ArcD/ProY family transporter n=1 Tax=Alkalihalobacillus sp. TS-13 TaxID=2842455 RepID=UPI001C8826B7|nr:endospore germination permease [Alkalihalobacillus sp. TS-13]
MKNKPESITKYQLIFMILLTQIGVGVLSLPFSVQQVAGSDGWISVIIAGVVVQFLIFLIWLLGRRFPDKTIFGISEQVAGKVLGKVIIFTYVLYGILVVTLILILYENIIKLWVLQSTPRWIVLILMITTCWFLVKDRIRVIARFYMFVTIFIPLLFLLTLVAFPGVMEYRYLLPVGAAGMMNILKGAHAVLISMLGFEMLLLLFPYAQANDREILKSVSIASGVTSLLYLYLVLVSFVVFSPIELKLIPQPVLYMLKAITFQVVERIDLLFIAIWIVVVGTSLMSYALFAAIGLQQLFKQKKHSKMLYIIFPVAFVGALIPQTDLQIASFSKVVEYSSYVFIIVIPMVLLLLSIFQNQMRKRRTGR